MLQYVIRGIAHQLDQGESQAFPGPDWLQEAAADMLENYRHHSFSLEDLALRYGLSPSHVSRQFTRHLGRGPVACSVANVYGWRLGCSPALPSPPSKMPPSALAIGIPDNFGVIV